MKEDNVGRIYMKMVASKGGSVQALSEDAVSDEIDHQIEYGGPDDHLELAYNSELRSHHIDKLIAKNKENINKILSQNPAIQPHHIDKLIDKGDSSVHFNLSRNPSLQPHHIDKLIDTRDKHILFNLAVNPALTPDHIHEMIVNHRHDPNVNSGLLLSHPSIKPYHLDVLADDVGYKHNLSNYALWKLGHHPLLRPETIDHLINTTDNPHVNRGMLERKDLTRKQRARLTED